MHEDQITCQCALKCSAVCIAHSLVTVLTGALKVMLWELAERSLLMTVRAIAAVKADGAATTRALMGVMLLCLAGRAGEIIAPFHVVF